MNRCDICVEDICKGKYTCTCSECEQKSECYRVLHPTIRLTTKCTQKCEHCCFECSPEGTKMMDIETAYILADFIKNNEITSANIMGGEFFLNPNWYEILTIISPALKDMRLVTTGDWIHNKDVCDKLIKLNEARNVFFWIAISNDRWHTNKHVQEAEAFLKENYFYYYIGTKEEDNENVIVPIGRAEGTYGFMSTFGCYCDNPENLYGFLINEIGDIYKCGFGVWDYANIQEYREGGFAKRFKEFNKPFYDAFVPSCAACIRTAQIKGRTDLQKGNKGDIVK